MEVNVINEIKADAKTIRNILDKEKYQIDFFKESINGVENKLNN